MSWDTKSFGDRVLSAWAGLRAGNPTLSVLFESVVKGGRPFLVGGFARDAALAIEGRETRDVDIAVEGMSTAELISLASPWLVRRTRFGGACLNVEGLRVDLWPVAETWAFSNGLRREARGRYLPESVFASTDAIAVDLTKGTVFERGFFRTFEVGTIDVVFLPNPFPYLAAVRLLVAARDYALGLSSRATEYVGLVLRSGVMWDELLAMQRSHYGRIVLDGREWRDLWARLLDADQKRNQLLPFPEAAPRDHGGAHYPIREPQLALLD